MSIIKINLENCVACNECIRACPTKTSNIAHFSEKYNRVVIDIDDESCIKCGACVKHCPHNARYFEDDTDRFLNDLGKQEIAIIVAPAVKSDFEGYWRHVLEWFREQGANLIYDVSFGADICTWAHVRHMQKNPKAHLITQPCAAIVNYALKHNHKLLKNLSPIQSPMLCTAIYLRKYANFTGKIAALSPCIAKKDEFIRTNNIVDYNVTFEHIKEYFNSKRISFPKKTYSKFEFDSDKSYGGAIYPMPSGLKENLLYHVPNLSVTNSEGVDKIYRELDNYTKANEEYLPSVFDVLNCEYGCNGGSAVDVEYDYYKTADLMHNVNQYNKKEHKKNTNKLGQFSQFSFFDKNLKMKDFLTSYRPENIHLKEVSEKEIQEVFAGLGKTTTLDQNFNCHACGYHNCREMATSIARGLNVYENCHRYVSTKLNAEKDKISKINDQMLNATKKLKESVETLNENIESASSKVVEVTNNSKNNIEDINRVNTSLVELSNFNSTILTMTENISDNIKSYQQMTKDISSIARSINLLSLNASIESARAGEAGRGFSVVATNIRDLSDETKESLDSAQENESVITESVEKVYSTVSDFSTHIQDLSDLIKHTGNNISTSIDINDKISESLNSLSTTSSTVSNVLDDILEILSAI